ncbi:MAG: 5-(carboxyamino)imidazole ribonucleotide mutase [Galbitalea sp.]
MVSVPALVAIVMGSDSDWGVMADAAAALTEFGIDHEVEVVSAHRTPLRMIEFGTEARGRGIRVIIAGAGGAAHLPGMLAATTTLPVIGVPVPRPNLDGLDSLLSIVQMPAGVPVATVSIGGARNAAVLAARILSIADPALTTRLEEYARSLEAVVAQKNTEFAVEAVALRPRFAPGSISAFWADAITDRRAVARRLPRRLAS